MGDTKPRVDAQKLRTKFGAVNELLRTHYSVYVHLDSRKLGVIVPPNLRKTHLCLQIGLNMQPTPVRDLKIDDKGFNATLTFDRKPFTVYVPWSAVFAVVGDSGVGNVWQDDVPPEVDAPKREATFTDKQIPIQRDPEKHKKLPPGWGVIDGGKK